MWDPGGGSSSHTLLLEDSTACYTSSIKKSAHCVGEETDQSTLFKITMFRQHISSSGIICCSLSFSEDLCRDWNREQLCRWEQGRIIALGPLISFCFPSVGEWFTMLQMGVYENFWLIYIENSAGEKKALPFEKPVIRNLGCIGKYPSSVRNSWLTNVRVLLWIDK